MMTVSDEGDLDFLTAIDHDDILENSGGGLAGKPGQLEAVPVQV